MLSPLSLITRAPLMPVSSGVVALHVSSASEVLTSHVPLKSVVPPSSEAAAVEFELLGTLAPSSPLPPHPTKTKTAKPSTQRKFMVPSNRFHTCWLIACGP